MITTFRTILFGASTRGETQIRDAFSIELIDRKVQEVETSLKAAKSTLASLIQRQRSERKLVDALNGRIATLTGRVTQALDAGQDALAAEGADALAIMENEMAVRCATLDQLEAKVIRLRSSVEAGHRRLIDLKQGAISARAVRREQDMQMRMVRGGSGDDAITEAQELIDRVLSRDDPFEKSQILTEINDELSHSGVEQRLADAGFGDATKVTGAAVLERLKTRKS